MGITQTSTDAPPEAAPPRSEPLPNEAPKPVESAAQENARGSAESYLENSNFSRSGLIEQLEYEGYTKQQAVYGVNQTGL